jgi:hypothetical protein
VTPVVRFTLRPLYPLEAGCAGAGLDGLEKRTISCRESNDGSSVSQPLA